jgi:predicted acylesterase/phospholipase RssA
MARGELVGEVALPMGEPHSLTVRAARDTDVLRLSPEGFEALVARHPRVLLPIVRTLAHRLRTNAPADARAGRTQSLAVLPVDRDVPLAALVPRLLEGLTEAGRVLTLDAARFDALLGAGASSTTRDQPRFVRLSEWLGAAEAEHDFVVFIADAEPTPWTERCLRHADRVLIVARAGQAPSLGAQERLLAELPPARDLVLFHVEGASPFSDTARWLDAVPVERHHHVRAGSARDVHRVARFLSGRAVGVVLGGGGARGFAHAGVLRALEECGIPVDCVGGVSMGAVAAAAYAMGWGHEGVLSTFRRAFIETLPWKYDLPLVSVFDPRPGDRALQRIFGDTRIEDLWTSGFCVAANITRAQVHVFRRGPVWRAVRASGAFPGLVPPVPENGELLVDGGLLTNLPVDVMQTLSPGPVIACDVSREVELQVDPELTLSPTSRHMLLRRLRRSGPRFPGIAPILLRAVECREVAEKEARRRAAALYLTPPVAAFGLTDVKKIDAIVEAAYRYTLERLRDVPDTFPRQPVERNLR